MNTVTFLDNADKIELPKWPGMFVCGDKVTPEQAQEILVKTDRFMPDYTYACNDHETRKNLMAMFGIPDQNTMMHDLNKYFSKMDSLRSRLGVIQLEYLCNERIVSSYIDGPHGWCNWDGYIYSDSYNIGKYPSVNVVAYEWNQIAIAFPFLKLSCILFSGETCEPGIQPLVRFDVANGMVTVRSAKGSDAHVKSPDYEELANKIAILNPFYREAGIWINALGDVLDRIYGKDYPKWE